MACSQFVAHSWPMGGTTGVSLEQRLVLTGTFSRSALVLVPRFTSDRDSPPFRRDLTCHICLSCLTGDLQRTNAPPSAGSRGTVKSFSMRWDSKTLIEVILLKAYFHSDIKPSIYASSVSDLSFVHLFAAPLDLPL